MNLEKLKQVKQREKADKRRALEEAHAIRLQKALEMEAKQRAALARSKAGPEVPPEFREVVHACPKLMEYLDPPNLPYRPVAFGFNDSLRCLLRLPRVRNIEDWTPHGKSAQTLFKSLGEHLISRYKLPSFIWSAFFVQEATDRELFLAMIEWIAAGYSLFEFVKNGGLRTQLTKKSCHEFMQTPADLTILQGLRRAQVKAVEGDHRLYRALMGTSWGRSLGSADMEAFWQTVVAWFAKQAMLEPGQIGPMMDYLVYQRGQNANFTMKGRTAAALLRDTQLWHAQLARTQLRGYRGPQVFAPSGYKAAEYDFSRETHTEIWRIKELLTARELADEGKRQNHCVFSYNAFIARGEISIWVLTKEDNEGNWAMLTVEVRNHLRQIVQARGRFNRGATPQELQTLQRWAAENLLTINVGRW